MNRTSSNPPGELPPIPPRPEGVSTVEGDEALSFDWGALVPFLVHPMRVSIIEALWWVGQPLSATDIRKLFDREFDLSFVSYHVVRLARTGAITLVKTQPVRGSLEKFYFFP